MNSQFSLNCYCLSTLPLPLKANTRCMMVLLSQWFCLSRVVPQMLALMVDLEDDPEWSTSDDADDEYCDR